MTRTGSMQLLHELRIHNHLGCSKRHNVLTGKGGPQVVNMNLSSHVAVQDALSFHLLSSARGSICPISTKCNVFLCKSVMIPGGGNEIPVLKSVAVVLKRSYGALCRSPLILQLIPAAGIIAFAAWGLGPIVRLGRVILFRRTDSTWKKSNSHYFMTSYLQPLLLWTGATLLCRSLDLLILPSESSQAVKQRLLNFVRSLSSVMTFAYCLSSLIQLVAKYFLETSDSSDARNMGFNFAGKAVYTAVWVAAVSLFMELLGFSTQKWLTAGGLGTVLLTLAGREIFTNFLSSVMIHATQPFVVNEWIQTKIEGYEVSGTVEHVGWWSPTIIRGDDREAVHIPNHKFTVNVVRNLSQKSHWRIKTYLAISHLDVHKINNIVADMRKVLAKNSQVEQQRLHRRVFLEKIDPENQALMIFVSCFVKTSHFEEYLCVKEAILLDLLRVISHHQARLATPIRTVQKVYSEPDLENVPFAETIFGRSRTATNRPFLLIEPSYKIYGDEKAKASNRSVNSNEESNGKVEASDIQADANAGSADVNFKRDKDAASSTSDASTATSDSEPQSGTVEPNESMETTRTNSDTIKRGGMSEQCVVVGNQDSGNEKADISPAKQDVERFVMSESVVRSPLEENIVLGVALEGSKRTLMLEEDIPPSPISAESKELAARGNGNSSSAGKDKDLK